MVPTYILETIESRVFIYSMMWSIVLTLLYIRHLIINEQAATKNINEIGSNDASNTNRTGCDE